MPLPGGAGRQVIAMVLAAGQSRRMGQPKQFLPYGDGTIVEAVIDEVLGSSVDGLVVVGNPAVEEYLRGRLPERCVVAINDDPSSEMIASARIGHFQAKATFGLGPDDGILLLLGDQPEVGAGVMTTCVEAFRQPRHPPGILITRYGRRRGHPTVFAVRVLSAIEAWSDDRRLNELAEAYLDDVRELPITAPMPIDVNTPEDYKNLKDD